MLLGQVIKGVGIERMACSHSGNAGRKRCEKGLAHTFFFLFLIYSFFRLLFLAPLPGLRSRFSGWMGVAFESAKSSTSLLLGALVYGRFG